MRSRIDWWAALGVVIVVTTAVLTATAIYEVTLKFLNS